MLRSKTFGVAFVSALIGSAATALVTSQFALALSSGDTVTFVITTDSNQPEPPAGVTDKFIFTGGRVTNTDATGCGGTSVPVQNGVLVDPSGGRSGRIIGAITVSNGSDAVPPGTKLTNLVKQTTCTIGTVTYNRYQGTVE